MTNAIIPVQSAPGNAIVMTTLIPGTGITVTVSGGNITLSSNGASYGLLYPIVIGQFSN